MSRKRSILAICQFGGENGWGHLIRTSALCEFARSEGWETELCTASQASVLTGELKRAFSTVTQYETLELDEVLGRKNALDIVLIDEMYQPDAYFEKARSYVEKHPQARLVVLDDLGRRSLDAANLVVNTELGLTTNLYRSESALLGEKYALVRTGISRARKMDWPADPQLVPVMVMVGGTDPFGWTEKALLALKGFGKVKFAPWVVSGDGSVGGSVSRLLEEFPEFQYETAVSSKDLGRAILTCRFGIIGCGSSIFEFAAMKRKFMGLCVADNQEKTALRIESDWDLPVVRCSGEGDFARSFRNSLARLMQLIESESGVSYSKVDFLGPKRVMDEIGRL